MPVYLKGRPLFNTSDMMETDDDSKADTLSRLWSKSLLVMMCVTSVSFRPWAMAVGPSVAYRVTTVKFKHSWVISWSGSLWVQECLNTHVKHSGTHVGNCTWSRLVLPRSTLLLSHRRWQFYTEAFGQEPQDRCQKTLLHCRFPRMTASCSSPELPTHEMQRYVQWSEVSPHRAPHIMN